MPATVAFLMPVFNAENFVGEAIESVLRQQFTDFELHIYNDGSTDRSEHEILRFKDSRIRYHLVKKNAGYVNALNLGLKEITSEFICRIDADDLCEPDRIQKQLDIFSNNPKIGVCGSAARLLGKDFSSDTIWFQPANHEDILIKAFNENPMIHPSVMFRKILVDQIGFYNETLMPSEDLDYWIRASRVCKLYNIPEPLIRYRIHDSQISKTENSLQKNNAERVHISFITETLNCKENIAEIIYTCLNRKKKLEGKLKVHVFRKVMFSNLPFQVKKYLLRNLL